MSLLLIPLCDSPTFIYLPVQRSENQERREPGHILAFTTFDIHTNPLAKIYESSQRH